MKAMLMVVVARIVGLARFLPVYLRELTLANLRVARDALRKEPGFAPGFVEVPLAGYDPVQQWGAACLISLTPGTLAVELREDRSMLLVHALYLSTPEQTGAELAGLLRQALGEPTPSRP